ARLVGGRDLRRPGCGERPRRPPLVAGRPPAPGRGARGPRGQRGRVHPRRHRGRRARAPGRPPPPPPGPGGRDGRPPHPPPPRVSTEASRGALPAEVPLGDAADTLARAIGLVLALEQGRLEDLPEMLVDRLHEPYRARLVPGLEALRGLAGTEGHIGATIS